MSKHHHYHHSQAGSFHHPSKTQTTTAFDISEMMVQQQQQPSNGLMRVNGQINGDIDSNDTNNNYNKHNHHNHHHSHGHHKRSASSCGEPSSSKRTKLNSGGSSSSSSQSVPNYHAKYGNSSINSHGSHLDHSSLSTTTNNGSGGSNNHSYVSNSNTIGGAGLQNGHYNIMEKLKELYRELKGDKSLKNPYLSSSSFLLDKLVTRERLNTLIVNLYPGNKGYSLAFRSPNSQTSATITKQSAQSHQPASNQTDREIIHETPTWLYDNAHLLDALDAEELPPLLIDFCNKHCPHLYYNGTVIAQVRDYRQSYPLLDICDIHYVLLKPTSVALWDEVSAAASDASWSMKERILLESQLVLATAPPICLDPSPAIGIAAINATTERSPIASGDGVLKAAKKFLQVTKNRNNKLEKKTHHPQLSLANHVANERRQRRDANGMRSANAPKKLSMVSSDEVNAVSLHKALPNVPPSQRYDWQARNTERLTFETDRDNCQYRVRVELFERATTCEVSGQLTLERQKGGNSNKINGRTCPFKLASPLAARRYVKEFMGIFTEEGRKFVKITHERETRAGREIMEMQTGEKLQQPSATKVVQTIPVITQQTQPQSLPHIQQQQQQQSQPPPPQIQTLQQLIASPSASITSPPPPALVATTPTAALKLTATPQRIIAARPSSGGQQVVVLAQVKQESPGNQAIKNLLNQPRAPMTQSMVNGLSMQGAQEVQTVYLQVDNSNLIHMANTVPAGLQFQQLIVPTQQATQTGPQTYTMNVQTVTSQQVTVVKRHRDM
ncbi:hypothetical protein PVAND_014507 [Polypedilum vanderplanki]|uniref:Spt20-like SEP domain-containing protein n=1 Tax=Polypedilum vanderplanki TaxID=319348 RepID=A0A9J6BA70_POLVA|nr:hypothetical protein PVAND_014507 [Polypedilum vanderplanki]